jgi:hypothetical protein
MSTSRKSPTKNAKKAKPAEPRLSRTRRPPELQTVDWQTALRRQFGREQNFRLENVGQEPVFSDFRVTNPATRMGYSVSIRGDALGHNACTCLDYATNDLGTCKHIEFTLAKLQAKRGAKAAFRQGFQSSFSEIWLDYAGARRVRFSAGAGCPDTLLKRVTTVFDADAGWTLRRDQHGALEQLMQAAQSSGHELRCRDDVWQFIAQLRDAERRQVVLQDAYPKGIKDKALKRLLKVKLYPYQMEGALFAAKAGR